MKTGPWFRVLGLGLGFPLLVVFTACDSRDSVVPGAQSSSRATMATAIPTVEPTRIVAALPRDVDTLALAMSRVTVEAQVGTLDCHATEDGVNVCHPQDPDRARKDLELFFFHDAVVSIAYAIPPPAEVWSHLEALINQYGKPSLNGMTQRDAHNRTHEVYGWRDTRTLYSTRFVWEESPPPRRLAATIVTIWDRAAYAEWEEEKARNTPTKTDSSADRLT